MVKRNSFTIHAKEQMNLAPAIQQLKLYYSEIEYIREIARLNFEIKRKDELIKALKRSRRTCKGWITKNKNYKPNK